MADVYSYMLGLTSGTIVNVETLMSPPRSEYQPFSLFYTTGDGQELGDGHAKTTWVIDYMTEAQLTTLMAYFGTAQSVTIYIRTRSDTRAWVYRTGKMHRPKVPEDMTMAPLGAKDVTIRFTQLEAFTP